jgi:hypothetical protein
MRAVLHADVVTAARALLAVPEAQRPALVERMLDEAGAADAYRKRFRRLHPLWCDGTLRAVAALRRLAPEPPLNDSDYCGCLIVVLEALLGRRSARPRGEAARFIRHQGPRPLQVAGAS